MSPRGGDGSLPEPFCCFVLGFQPGFIAAQRRVLVIGSLLRLGATGSGDRGGLSGNDSGITGSGITACFS